MNDPALALLGRLADGAWHAGPDLSAGLDVSRAAVWKQIEGLRQAGLPIDAEPGRGYRLGQALELLDPDCLRAALPAAVEVTVLPRSPSTNAELVGTAFVHRKAVLTEWQYAGRGRRGRSWVSPPATGIALSYGYRFDAGLSRLAALSLVAGVACADALHALGAAGVQLKWPNDLMLGDRKAGGLLVELQGAADGPCEVVIGIGLNLWLPKEASAAIDQPWSDLGAAGLGPDRRNAVAAALIGALDRACETFAASGFAPFRERWEALDMLQGRDVEIREGSGRVSTGRVIGLGEGGSLLVRTSDGPVELSAGDVSVRGRG